MGVVGFVDAVVPRSGDEVKVREEEAVEGEAMEVEGEAMEDDVVGVDLSVADLERYASMFGGFFFLRTGIVCACVCVCVLGKGTKK